MTDDQLSEEVEKLLDKGKLKEALRLLKAALRRDPNSVAAHFNLNCVYARMRKYRLALKHGRRTLRLSPDEPNACLNVGVAYDGLGNDRAASRYYRRELERDMFQPETISNLGRLYFRKRRWKAASKYLQRCLDVWVPTRIDDTVYKLGICYQHLNDVHAYIRAYERYLNVNPDSAWAARNLAGAFQNEKEYKRAFLLLKKAFRLNPSGSIAEELAQIRKSLSEGFKGEGHLTEKKKEGAQGTTEWT